MGRRTSGPGADPTGWLGLGAILLAIPALALCCGGPLLIASLVAGIAAIVGWASGFLWLGLVALVVAGSCFLIWRIRQRRRKGQPAWRSGIVQ